jgi:hypothetical protein
MRRSTGVAISFPVLVLLSAYFLGAAYTLAGEVTGIDSTEDTFFVADSIIYTCVAVWCIATAVGVWRLRGWGRTSILWLSCAVCLIYLPNVLWYAYLVKTAPDVGWSWGILYPLAPLVSIAVWWLILFTRPRVKGQFLRRSDTVGLMK